MATREDSELELGHPINLLQCEISVRIARVSWIEDRVQPPQTIDIPCPRRHLETFPMVARDSRLGTGASNGCL